MLFWTVILLISYMSALMLANPLVNGAIHGANLLLKCYDNNLSIEEKEQLQIKAALTVLGAIAGLILLLIIELIYVIVALKIDPIKYPSLLMLLGNIISIIKIFKGDKKSKKNDLETEEGRMDYKLSINKLAESFSKPKSIIINSLNILYFVYMFYILMLRM